MHAAEKTLHPLKKCSMFLEHALCLLHSSRSPGNNSHYRASTICQITNNGDRLTVSKKLF